MDLLTKEDLRTLTEPFGEWCVSLYMPTVRAGSEVQQNPIRFKNLLRDAYERLMQLGMRSPEAQELLDPAQSLLNDADFWRNQGNGLAVFVSCDLFQHYRLPVMFEELVVVTTRFHIKPLLPALSGDGQFYILAVAQNEIRLFEATRDSVIRLELDGVPESMDEALWADDSERQLQMHSISEGNRPGGDTGVMFHGHNPADDAKHKQDYLRFFQMVDRGLQDVLKRSDCPLVLAGVDYLLPLYREANTYPHLIEGITGNPEGWSAKELHERAWVLVEPYFKRFQDEQRDLFIQYMGQNNGLASNDLREVLEAATLGRVATLFVARGVRRWGEFDPTTFELELHDEMQPDDQDLLDLAVVQTLINDGTVYAVDPNDVPGGEALAAIFRYPL